jgi:phosphoribosyl 1,2-cyclic phosphodiesterase
VKVRLWGTRGSIAAAGPETVRYGGNTACVEVRPTPDHVIVLDAGTGIRRLGMSIGTEVRRIDILLTHLHMDHVQGLGFFAPLFRAGTEIHLWGPPAQTAPLRDRLTRYLSPPLFPVALRDLRSELKLHEAPMDGPFELGTVAVRAGLVIHPGPTVGFRLTDGRRALAYLPDHEPALGSRSIPKSQEWVSGTELAAGAEVLIHDAQYTDSEYASRVGWGHSTIGHAVALANIAGVRRLITFHHDPGHDDEMLDAMVREAPAIDGVEVIGGREGLELDTVSAGHANGNC